MRVLLVEDDATLQAIVAKGLREEEIDVVAASDWASGLERVLFSHYDVIVLDVVLPGGSGIDLCRRVREAGSVTPILMLTARDTVQDRVTGLEAGADDYLIKPFAFAELVARVRALARRSANLIPHEVEVADLSVDLRSHRVRRGGRDIELTHKEWDLLEVFIRNRGAVIDRTLVTGYVWDDNHDPSTNALDVLVRRLRSKIDDGFDVKLIQTVRGSGYQFGA